ncbi:MAG: hypothetical protein WCI04_02435 [archaeon]
MKATSWLIIIISILLVAAISFSIDLWAGEWKDLFFYLDDWRMWIVIFVTIWVVKKILEWALKTEVRVLK